MTAFPVRDARVPDDLPTVRDLFEEYLAFLGTDLAYQGWADELAGLPGKYAPPRGGLWLAAGEGETVAGCIALRPLDADRAEIKRLYVRPAFRGQRLGQALAVRAIDAATSAGYRQIVLDTWPSLASATSLYRSLGFREIEPYYPSPVAGTLYFGRALC